MKSIVVAVDRNMGIGADNDLLWQRDLPADLAHFKKLTTGTSIIMGRKTFESIGRPLPDRENIVVSRTPTGIAGVLTVASLESAYELARYPISVIGGGQIYAQAINDVDVLHVTYVDAEFPQATVFFPQINCEDWEEVSRDHHEADEKNKFPYDFVTYRKLTTS
jgi:dihydrofolate reductase